ncbi:aromatase/cyclase [Micromonospora wenchangensis]|uniref:aromatase/cyclase n=1 Tax=Micromonospora wenchangensis TaxID=1185415 RepID=UPI003816620E
MSDTGEHEVEHEITVRAPRGEVYRLLADVTNWPRIFPPSVHVQCLERTGGSERIQIWATANGEPKNWTSRRELDPQAMRIEFTQEVTAPPVAAMSGTWILEEGSARDTRLRLLHRFRAAGDDPAALDWIVQAVDSNSRSELASLKANIELATMAADRTMSFTDSVTVDGAAKDLYEFVHEAQLWSERLPHVADVRLTEATPGLQKLWMRTLSKDGGTHTTESVRVCFPYRNIVYKQTTLPALMSLHTGYWAFTEDDEGVVTAISQHTVTIRTENIAAVLGPGADLEQARRFVRGALGANSRATLGHAKAYAETRR